ncbi:MAG: tetratricopeptide repeat protein [Holophagales bacterium]|jgi:tetratricopeptide (TPR) repeat protein|nr:tetratricopeptide repeat protein [Holophagales bacterium]
MLSLCAIPTLCFLLGAQKAAYQPRVDLDQGRFLKVLADADARLNKNDDDALAWAAKSQALNALMRLDEAEDAMLQALKLQPNLPEALMARGMVKASKALQQRNLGSLFMVSQAMNDLRSAVKNDPNYALAWMTLGLGYQQLPGPLGGSTKKALECADQLKRIQPARGDLLQAQILSMDGKWNEAEPIFKRALDAAPGDPGIVTGYLDELGEKNAGKALGETVQKQKLAVEAMRLLPRIRTRARGVEAVSLALLNAGQDEDSWKVALNALLDVDAPSIIRLQLGKVAARTGLHTKEGLAFLEQAAKEPMEGGTGGYATLHWRRGQILKKLGRLDEARNAAKKALSYDYNHRGAKELLNELG